MALLINQLKITNFRSITNATIPLQNFGILIGRNNAGKSNILEAIRLLFEGTAKEVSDEDFHGPRGRRSENFAIEATLKGIGQYLDLFARQHRSKIEACVQDDAIRVQRKATRTAEISLDKINVWDPQENKFVLPTGIENALKQVLPEIIYIEAFKDPLSEATGKTQTALGRLLKHILESVRTEVDSEIKSSFEKAQSLLNVTEASGTDDKRAQAIKEVETLIQSQLSQVFREMNIRLRFSFPEVEDLFAKTSLELEDHGIWTSMERKGQGSQRTIYFSLLQVLAKTTRKPGTLHRPFIMLVEEPEIFLHPPMQRQIAESLEQISTTNQVVIATHSPLLVTPQNIPKTIIVRKQVNQSVGCTCLFSPDFESFSDPLDKQLARMLTLTNSAEFLFADRVVVVEGTSDCSLMKAAWSHSKELGLPECHLSIIEAGTKDALNIWCQMLRKMGFDSCALADLDFLWRGAGKVIGSDKKLSVFCDAFWKLADKEGYVEVKDGQKIIGRKQKSEAAKLIDKHLRGERDDLLKILRDKHRIWVLEQGELDPYFNLTTNSKAKYAVVSQKIRSKEMAIPGEIKKFMDWTLKT